MENSEKTPEEEELEKKHLLLLEEREKKFKPFAHFSNYAYGVLILVLLILFFIGVIPRFLLENEVKKLAAETYLPKVTILEAKASDQPIELTLPVL